MKSIERSVAVVAVLLLVFVLSGKAIAESADSQSTKNVNVAKSKSPKSASRQVHHRRYHQRNAHRNKAANYVRSPSQMTNRPL
ncbi:MAG: hypothetical protein K2W95_04285 [Candidatus Obscuribacterales bacterium]|nr:hypothetical protein [Candidatus Obscuribacterales bacterium]